MLFFNLFFFIFFFIFLLLISSINSSTFSFSKFNKQNDCIDLICQINNKQQNKQKELIDINTGIIIDKCNKCNDCTNSGYSVCLQSTKFDLNKFVNEGNCECSHSGPSIINNNNKNIKSISSSLEENDQNIKNCKVLEGKNQKINEIKLNENEGFYKMCYSSALRKLPIPQATNEQIDDQTIPTVLVTVKQFWHDKYWQTLKPFDLHLYYVFPVNQTFYCEGEIDIPDAQELIWINAGKVSTSGGMPRLCKTKLKLKMDGIEDDVRSEEDEGGDDGTDNYDYQQSNIDPKMPQEVQFERNVFAGAERVRFYYEVTVKRENQLKTGAGKPKFEQRITFVRSDTLDFELYPEIYGTGMEEELLQRNNSLNTDKDKYDLHHLPIVRPSVRTSKGKEKSIEKYKTGSYTTKMKQTSPKVILTNEIIETEPTTLVPIPTLKKIEKDIESSQPYLTSNLPKTEIILSQDNILINEVDKQSLKEAENFKKETETTKSLQQATLNIKNLQEETTNNKEIREAKYQDWLLFRNVLLAFLVLLFIIIILAICYNRSFCIFSGRIKSRENNNNINGQQQQQINGGVKKRVQNGKEYKEACNNYT